MQDSHYRRVKRISWGIRILPVAVLNLDYDASAEQRNFTQSEEDHSGLDGPRRGFVLYMVGWFQLAGSGRWL